MPFLLAALGATQRVTIPVMHDTDGQRPDTLGDLVAHLALVQVVIEFTGPDAAIAHAVRTVQVAAAAKCAHSLVLCPKDDTSDAQLLRIVEQIHATSQSAQLVIHPMMTAGDTPVLDRRWSTLLEQAVVMHDDCRIAMRIPPPAGLR